MTGTRGDRLSAIRAAVSSGAIISTAEGRIKWLSLG
jgi:hypothetical protein